METLPSGTPAHLARSEGASRGLIVIPDVWGLRPLFTEMCDDLAARTGWSVGTFEPFPGRDLPNEGDADAGPARFAVLPELSDDRLLGDAVDLADLTGCDDVGLIGFCMGGMYALKAAATYFHAKVAVRGGYVYYVTPDLAQRWGEGKASPTTVFVQPPGTPAVSSAATR